ncbi:ROK family transcriptional regulator [Marvinbryantia formatexigens]|nr:ROK family protein [Marvinbryantia formatexigens]UWO26168.1 ROK family transcriptional regulator [Marvinbryantia formatexigens DSM 14469]SDF93158.1 Sugar kinase of the NBD/HSP70 family, may contain an N-terminal HTH domain [Marvinbryantia formatexigens]
MARMTGKNNLTSKQFNRGLLLKLIATQNCRTRIELSKATGLTKMTVTNIVSEFIQQGLVAEREEVQTEVCGRNPILLEISGKAPKVIGLLIFRDRIEAVLCTLSMQKLASESIHFDSLTKEQLYAHCFSVIDRLLEKEKNIFGIGVAAIGPVDIWKGVILNPPRFYGIQNVPVREALEKRYALPVFFDHDNNSAALAELLFGIGRNVQDFLFVGISNGIGSGIVSGGRVYHSHRGLPPEIGHISIDRRGPLCACGNRGCLELYANTHIVLEKLRAAKGRAFSGERCAGPGDALSANFCRAEEGASFADFCREEGASFADFCRAPQTAETEEIFEEMLQDVSAALVTSVNILHPEMIVLGHDCIDWDERLVGRLEELVNERKVVHDQRPLPVKKAYFGKEAQLIGAACNAVDQMFRGFV